MTDSIGPPGARSFASRGPASSSLPPPPRRQPRHFRPHKSASVCVCLLFSGRGGARTLSFWPAWRRGPVWRRAPTLSQILRDNSQLPPAGPSPCRLTDAEGARRSGAGLARTAAAPSSRQRDDRKRARRYIAAWRRRRQRQGKNANDSHLCPPGGDGGGLAEANSPR